MNILQVGAELFQAHYW